MYIHETCPLHNYKHAGKLHIFSFKIKNDNKKKNLKK